MLTEKAGQFRFEPYGVLDGAGDGPILPSRIHKYDFSDPVVIEVKRFSSLVCAIARCLESEKSSSERSADSSSSSRVDLGGDTSSTVDSAHAIALVIVGSRGTRCWSCLDR